MLKRYLFYNVLIVILLHTIIPHPHSDEMTDEAHYRLHSETNSIFDFIRIVFHESDDAYLDTLFTTSSFENSSYKIKPIHFDKGLNQCEVSLAFLQLTPDRISIFFNHTYHLFTTSNQGRAPPKGKFL